MIPHARWTVDWARQHAEYGPDGLWRCKDTKTVLRIQKVWRTIGAEEDFPFSGLEVKRVAHVFCPSCTPFPNFRVSYGNQIALKDLIGYQP